MEMDPLLLWHQGFIEIQMNSDAGPESLNELIAKLLYLPDGFRSLLGFRIE